MSDDQLLVAKINKNLDIIKRDIELYAKEKKSLVKILAVTKYGDIDSVLSAYRCGLRHFGENRIQNLADKVEHLKELKAQNELPKDIDLSKIHWHFIGRLQKNKINKLLSLPGLHSIHSIDSLDLLKDISKKMDRFSGDTLHYFVQVNTSNELNKSGLQNFDDVINLLSTAKSFDKRLVFSGLMTMSATPDPVNGITMPALDSFLVLAKMRQKILSEYLDLLPQCDDNFSLSMGMSSDYKEALKAGANWLRIGSMLFH